VHVETRFTQVAHASVPIETRFRVAQAHVEPAMQAQPAQTLMQAQPAQALMQAPDVCAICTEPCVDAVLVLECGHQFHGVCVARWFRRNPACPMCRALPP
jgi:hypothetical protein